MVVLFVLLSFCTLFSCTSGDFGVLTWETTIINPVYNHTIPLLIHYPNDNSQKYPLMVFNHGGDCKNTWYDYIWQNLVPQGYIVAMPNDYSHLYINQFIYSASQRYTLDYLMLYCNNNISCPLYNIISNKSIASGHSMGGGASFLSISNYNVNETFVYEFDAAFTLSGCGWRYNTLQNALRNTPNNKSIFIMSGTNDCICPPVHDSNVYYSDIPIYNNTTNSYTNICKFLGNIYNGTHCGFEEASEFGQEECNLAEFVECPIIYNKDYNIPLQTQYNIVNKYMTLFTNAVLKQNRNEKYIQQIINQLNEDEMNGIMGNVANNCTNYYNK